jgi:hypothetical protein
MGSQEPLDSELSKIEAGLDEYDREMDGGKFTTPEKRTAL